MIPDEAASRLTSPRAQRTAPKSASHRYDRNQWSRCSALTIGSLTAVHRRRPAPRAHRLDRVSLTRRRHDPRSSRLLDPAAPLNPPHGCTSRQVDEVALLCQILAPFASADVSQFRCFGMRIRDRAQQRLAPASLKFMRHCLSDEPAPIALDLIDLLDKIAAQRYCDPFLGWHSHSMQLN